MESTVKPDGRASADRPRNEAGRLAEVFPRMMRALDQLTHGEDMAPENPTPSQFKVLNALSMATGPMRMSEIAKELRISQASLTDTAKRLAAQQYITRARMADDERVVHVSLTPKGREQVVEMERKTLRFFRQVCGGLNPNDREKLVECHEFIFNTYLDALTKTDPGRKG